MRLSVSSLNRRPQQAQAQAEDYEPLLPLDSSLQQQNTKRGKPPIVGDGGLVKLVVLKLDGTSFDVCVPREATVGEMKSILERTVSELQIERQGYCDIQWQQVWSNFCLCYMNQKLLNDDESLRALGIHYDDQLEFIRHSAIQEKRRSSFCKFVFD